MTAQGHFIYARDPQAKGHVCGNIENMNMILAMGDHGKALSITMKHLL